MESIILNNTIVNGIYSHNNDEFCKPELTLTTKNGASKFFGQLNGPLFIQMFGRLLVPSNADCMEPMFQINCIDSNALVQLKILIKSALGLNTNDIVNGIHKSLNLCFSRDIVYGNGNGNGVTNILSDTQIMLYSLNLENPTKKICKVYSFNEFRKLKINKPVSVGVNVNRILVYKEKSAYKVVMKVNYIFINENSL